MARPPTHALTRLHGYEHSDEGLDRAVLKRGWAFAADYRRLLLINIGGIIAAAAIGILPPLLFKRLIDHAIPQHDFATVNWLFVAAVAIAFATTGLGLFNRWLSALIGEGLIYDLRVALYRHVGKMPVGFFTRTQTGSLLSRLNNDVVGAQATVTTAATFSSDLLTLVITISTMAFLSWKVTLLALLVVPLFIVLDRKVGRRLALLSRRRMDANADMTSNMQERFNVSGAILVKLFGRPHEELDQFSQRADYVRATGIKTAVITRFYYGALALTAALGTAIVYWLGARSVINGGITIGTLTALAAYVTRLYEPLTSIAGARVDLLSALVSFDRCFDVLDAPLSVTDKPDAKTLQHPQGRIRFDDVWFRYPAPDTVSIKSLEAVARTENDDKPSDWILKGVSLTAEPGQLIALVGHTGAGKTTLTSLIPRLFDVDRGSVTFDGHDVRDLTLQSLTDAIGVVSQDTHLFHDSVTANLRYAKPDATDAEIVAACQGARIHDTIVAMPDGYNTIVGERGHRLSGGEKQRLAIARVLLKSPSVVILDEATAHLDSETEHLVQQALVEALHGRTAIVVAHRLSTIRAADNIVVLRNGEILQTGTHDELVKTGGLYADLYQTQYLPKTAL